MVPECCSPAGRVDDRRVKIDMRRIQIPISVMTEVKELLAGSQKIKAIKLVREVGKYVDEPSEQVGLKHAKHACDYLANPKTTSTTAILVPDWKVHSVKVSGPVGEEIELDVENLQMHFLTSLSSVGLNEVARLMDLVEYIRRWQGEIPPVGDVNIPCSD